MLSVFPPCECKSFEGKKLKDPPRQCQRFSDLNLLLGKEAALEWGRAQTGCSCFEHHPSQRWLSTIQPNVISVPSPSTFITNSLFHVFKEQYTYMSECVPANQTSIVCGCSPVDFFLTCGRSLSFVGGSLPSSSPSSLSGDS
jgi:hypothetical protein